MNYRLAYILTQDTQSLGGEPPLPRRGIARQVSLGASKWKLVDTVEVIPNELPLNFLSLATLVSKGKQSPPFKGKRC